MSIVKRIPDNQTRVFENVFNTDWLSEMSTNVQNFKNPAVNIHEDDDSFSLFMAAPGMKKENFIIELDNKVLSISSESKTETSNNAENEVKGKFTRKEFELSTFKRSFSLPESADNKNIVAGYENGILKISLPKKEEAKVQPKRNIEIS